jgi:3-hydroxyisobutyrate dehydrogenase
LWTIHAAAIGEAMVAVSAWASHATSGGAPYSARRPTAFILCHDVPSIFAGHYDPSFPIALYPKDLGLSAS